MNFSVFILAAGLGERLRPITNYIPKPLVPILGKPVLQSVLENTSVLPVHKMGINLHYKKDAIEDWLIQSGYGGQVEIFREDPVLGTGGALKNAEDFLKNGSFLIHNSDILTDIDLGKLVEHHLSSGNLATLAVHDYPEFNKLLIDENGFLMEAEKENPPSTGERITTHKRAAFTGIAVYRPEFLNLLPSDISSVVDTWLRAIAMGYKIGTLDVSGCYWTDIGTPASYAKAVIRRLRKNGEMIYIDQDIKWCHHAEMDGYVVIEKESSCDRVSILKNCIILPGTNIGIYDGEGAGPKYCREEKQLSLTQQDFRNSPLEKEDKGRCEAQNEEGSKEQPPPPPLLRGNLSTTSRSFTCPTGQSGEGGHQVVSFENCILGPGFKIDLDDSDLYNLAESNAALIGTGGSDRKYYRVKRDGSSAVLMKCPDADPDFGRHIEYTQFFQKYLVPVPELIDADFDNRTALFEDVGDLSLYNWLKCPREQDRMEEIYRKVIDILILIHTKATEHIAGCALIRNRVFDYEHLRWETGYFLERFVRGIRSIRVKNSSSLEDEFHRLAVNVDSFRKTIIHRDFQSQNIIVTKGGKPRLLDFQSARIGPPAYDVASILWDPYYRLEDNLRERLLDYYTHKIIPPPNPPFGKGGQGRLLADEFMQTLLPCRLQRHMQALGAYGFLSAVKEKKYFLKYIPEGVRLLKEDTTLAKNEYPTIHALAKEL